MKEKNYIPLSAVIQTVLVIFSTSCQPSESTLRSASEDSMRIPLVVIAAGSLIIPFNELEKAFEADYPNIDVRAEYHGSIQVIRHVTELYEPIDVAATADASLIPMLMYETIDPQTNHPYADWYIRFASNRLAIAYNPMSLYADEINESNWMTTLARPDLKVGLADPRFDASGYRNLMAFALASDHLNRPEIFGGMFNGRFKTPITIFWEQDRVTVTVPEILETNPNSPIIIRGGSIELIALLESGDLDYAFEYESVIKQHDLEMLQLPDAFNLGSETIDYSNVVVILDYQRFASIQPEFHGERIGYGITIPKNAPHPEEAVLFISFLLGPKGREIMEANHHPMLEIPTTDSLANLPIQLRIYCDSEE